MNRAMLVRFCLLLSACYPENAGIEMLKVPDRHSFPLVADALSPSCGTLDCHGQPGRNLRLFGGRGLRLANGHSPAEGTTTESEYEASFLSLVGLEPEVLSEVVSSHGDDPERLILIRKARGKESHKGGVQMLSGDPLDRCLVSWLSGHIVRESCLRVARAPGPQASLSQREETE